MTEKALVEKVLAEDLMKKLAKPNFGGYNCILVPVRWNNHGYHQNTLVIVQMDKMEKEVVYEILHFEKTSDLVNGTYSIYRYGDVTGYKELQVVEGVLTPYKKERYSVSLMFHKPIIVIDKRGLSQALVEYFESEHNIIPINQEPAEMKNVNNMLPFYRSYSKKGILVLPIVFDEETNARIESLGTSK